MAVNLQAKLALDSKGFHNNLEKANKGVKGLGATFTKLKGMVGAGLALGGAATFMRQFTDAADNIDNLASRLGTSTENVQKFQRAAERSGQTIEVVADAYKTLKVRVEEAAAGNKILQDQFDALGISQSNLEEADIDKIFAQLQEALTKSGDRVGTLAVAMKLLGEPVEKLLPILDTLNAGVGDVVSEDNIAALDKLDHNWARHWDRIKTTSGNAAGWISKAFMAITAPFDVGREDPAKMAAKLAEQREKDLKSLKDIEDKNRAEEEAKEKRKEQEKKQKEIDKSKSRFDKVQRDNLLDRLTDEEKLTQLKKEQLEFIEKAEELNRKGDEAGFFDAMADAAGLDSQIKALQNAAKPLGGIRIQQSQMQQAGARIAGVDKRMALLAKAQLDVQKDILRHIREGGGVFTLGKDGGLNPYTGN